MSVKVGDLAQYMSRTILIVDEDNTWFYGIEVGEEAVIAKYKKGVVRKKNEEEDFKKN